MGQSPWFLPAYTLWTQIVWWFPPPRGPNASFKMCDSTFQPDISAQLTSPRCTPSGFTCNNKTIISGPQQHDYVNDSTCPKRPSQIKSSPCMAGRNTICLFRDLWPTIMKLCSSLEKAYANGVISPAAASPNPHICPADVWASWAFTLGTLPNRRAAM